ncbi:unnamed protein product [Symbiodinium sp. CCMP2592]|nr:unnamed protein product [Symbiodinium sp. CCMP2592]
MGLFRKSAPSGTTDEVLRHICDEGASAKDPSHSGLKCCERSRKKDLPFPVSGQHLPLLHGRLRHAEAAKDLPKQSPTQLSHSQESPRSLYGGLQTTSAGYSPARERRGHRTALKSRLLPQDCGETQGHKQ